MSSMLKRAQKRVINQALNNKRSGESLGKDRTTIDSAVEALEAVGLTENQVRAVMRKAGITLVEKVKRVEHVIPDDFDMAMFDTPGYTLLPEDEIEATLVDLEAEVPGTLAYAHEVNVKIEHAIPDAVPLTQCVLPSVIAACLSCGNQETKCVLVPRIKAETGLGICATCVSMGVASHYRNVEPVRA